MASITTQRGGNRCIQFVDENSARKTIRLGKCDRKSAESFCRHVETLLAAATVAKRLSFARTFFHVARKHKLIDENPFCEVKIPTANVSLRQRFIDRDMVQKLLSVATPTWRTCNLRTTFGKLVKRAGLEPWPRLFHNLRSSRETELLEEFPVHVVAMWMGHDAKVSLKHYAQTTDEHFERATRAAGSDAPALQNAAQPAAVGNGGDSQTEDVNGNGMATCATPCESLRHTAHALSGEGGIRTTSKNSAKSVDFGQGGAESGALVPEPAAIDPDLAAVVDAWATLPAAIKAGILAMIAAAE
jgi:hypothetical protein